MLTRELILAALIVLASTSCVLAAAGKPTVLVEAESFADVGGWKVDQQFTDQMGSPFLLAHSLGEPAKDAVTTVTFPATGEYRLWVRTRDWVATWNAPGAPGRFKVLIDGEPVETTFGTKGAAWAWHDGGTVKITNAKTTVALRDLTGFDGRCDALLFTQDAQFTPPSDLATMTAWRKKLLGLPAKPIDPGKFDLVVVGGGIAGICSAVSAARSGLRVALVHNRPVLGGNNSSEVRVHLQGRIKLPPYPAIGELVDELGPPGQGNAQTPEKYRDNLKLRVVQAQKNLTLFLNTHAFAVEKTGNRIAAIIGRDIRTSKELRFSAQLFADCTGDGTIGFLAGAEFHMGREGRNETGEELAPPKADKMTMGSSVQWYAKPTDKPAPFPECPWAVQFNEKSFQRTRHGEWNWETGMNLHQIDDFEQVRDYGMRVVYGNWAFQKNHGPDKAKLANVKLTWMAYVAGKRESRRVVGDVILRQQDIEGRKDFPDACVTTTWTIDLHYPEPKNSSHFPGREFRSIAKHKRIKPYPIPYRCLYSRDIENLFMAGRNISVTHVALGTVRVMRTCGMMGEVVGMAAAICAKQDCSPRQVYTDHLDRLKARMTEGVGKGK